MIWGVADVMIVGDQSDLNVYKTASTDGEEVGCCGPASKKATSCSDGSTSGGRDDELKDLDLNEWAGEFLIVDPGRVVEEY